MSEAPQRRPAASLRTARVETLADGIFAIVMTLLVFDIRVPPTDSVTLLPALLELAPKLFSYALSFVILGVFWVGHHNQFHYIRWADRTLLWINILFFMCIAFVPFSASLLSAHGSEQIAVMVYGINMILAALGLYLHWWYATRDNHLLDHPLEPHFIKLVTRRILTPPIIYVVSIAVSFLSPIVSIGLYVLVPVAYIFPGRVDLHFRTRQR